jgi:integrase
VETTDRLDNAAARLRAAALTTGTRSAYETGVKSFLCFCKKPTLPEPPSEQMLERFCTFLAVDKCLVYRTIKLYLCGIRNAYIERGYGDILKDKHRLELTLRGIRKQTPATTRIRLPVSSRLLHTMLTSLDKGLFGYHVDKLLACVLSVGWFGAMRCGEFVAPRGCFDENKGLCVEDVTFHRDTVAGRRNLKLHLKFSKSDPYGTGVDILLFEIGGTLCPYKRMRDYLDMRTVGNITAKAPLFVNAAGEALYRSEYLRFLNTLLKAVGVDHSLYNGHSLRRGMATECCNRGISDAIIGQMGRWKSDSYRVYIENPLNAICQAQMCLAL